ncbi:hypothetical protein [Nostoc sp. CMAA1605]|uniref:hypothetical protein n=1 Tax=Nostoc sp. CMAA1605 TaxID=2055159 RepID=UPI001F3543E8|nr:hypothetical protein [Nostoc sp. CMAA1605]MCF4967853.1 hypothetical protein [Nostoc sp. CMAA1605]
MQTIPSSSQGKNIIGHRYEVISLPSQTPYWQNVSSTPTLKIQISIQSPLKADSFSQFNHNTYLLIKCLFLLNVLFVTSSEGLQEASEALENMVDYYRCYRSDWQPKSLPGELQVITGTVLPTEVRPPLVMDFE